MHNLRLIKQEDLSWLSKLLIDEDLHHWKIQDFENAINSETNPCFIIENFGFALFQKVLDEAEILMIYIDKNQRGNNFGEKLLGFSIKELSKNDVSTVFLEVAEDNESAKKLYEKLNFSKTGMRKNYYTSKSGKKTHAIMMTLKII